MEKIITIAASLVLVLSLAGCGSNGSTQASSASSNASSQNATVTEADRQAAAAYIGSAEYGALSEYVGTAIDGIVELADKGEVAEIQGRFEKLSGMITAMDSVSVPDTCKDVDNALKQLARAEAVALADFSEVAIARAAGDSNAAAKSLDEANEYLEQAKRFQTEFANATNELMGRFS